VLIWTSTTFLVPLRLVSALSLRISYFVDDAFWIFDSCFDECDLEALPDFGEDTLLKSTRYVLAITVRPSLAFAGFTVGLAAVLLFIDFDLCFFAGFSTEAS